MSRLHLTTLLSTQTAKALQTIVISTTKSYMQWNQIVSQFFVPPVIKAKSNLEHTIKFPEIFWRMKVTMFDACVLAAISCSKNPPGSDTTNPNLTRIKLTMKIEQV